MDNNRIVIFLTALALFLAVWLTYEVGAVNKLREAENGLKNDITVLIEGNEAYKVRDSLNAARIGVLELSEKDLKKRIREDEKLISELKGKNKELQGIAEASLNTGDSIIVSVRDTIIRRDTAYIEIPCIDVAERWFEMHGCIDNGYFIGYYQAKDSIILIESVQRARFLGFLWKTKKIKKREFSIISKNPHTKIEGFEVIRIKK